MRNKTVNMLPKILRGSVHQQFKKCGKPNCKCARGETHLAYYFFTRRNGKLVKFYVRKSDVAAFSELVNLVSGERAQRRESSQSSRALLKRLRESIRKYELMAKLYKQH